jgi:hypothetical protein
MSDERKAESPELTRKEYFAALAMQGILSNFEFLKLVLSRANGTVSSSEAIAQEAVAMSEALIEELINTKSYE